MTDESEWWNQTDRLITYLRDSANFDEALNGLIREMGITGRGAYRISYDEANAKIRIEPVDIEEIYE